MKTSDEKEVLELDVSSRSEKNYLKELDDIVEEWKTYRRALRGAETDAFDKLIDCAKVHATAGEELDHYKPMETFFISILLEQQMEIMRLKMKLEGQVEVDEEY